MIASWARTVRGMLTKSVPRLFAAVLAAVSMVATAQTATKVRTVGLLDAVPTSPGRQALWDGFRQQMHQLGYRDGQNITYDYRSSEGDAGTLNTAAAALAERKVDVIVAPSTQAALAVRRASSAIPIVVVVAADPVRSGLAASLAQPGGSVTGLTTVSTELGVKRMELLKELLPAASRVAVLWQPMDPPVAVRDTEAAARSLGLQVLVLEAHKAQDIRTAVAEAAKQGAQALLAVPGPLLLAERRQLVEAAAAHRLPTVYSSREYVEAGGLIAYGSSLAAHFARAAHFVDKILKGAKPAELPIEQPTQFELSVNLRTARALGLAIAPSLMLRADHVIR